MHSNIIHREIFVKDFSGTNVSRIFKLSTNVGYDFLYCVRESASSILSFPLFVCFSFSPIKISVTDFSAPVRARVFKFCIHLENGQVYCVKENQNAEIYFCLFPFSFFYICHSNLILLGKFVSKISQELLLLGF